jgi:hypothetical protein
MKKGLQAMKQSCYAFLMARFGFHATLNHPGNALAKGCYSRMTDTLPSISLTNQNDHASLWCKLHIASEITRSQIKRDMTYDNTLWQGAHVACLACAK